MNKVSQILKRSLWGVAVIAVILSYQNCASQFETMENHQFSSLGSLRFQSEIAGLSKAPTGTDDCSELDGRQNTQSDLSALIQGCLDRAVGKSLSLPPGVFYVDRPIFIRSGNFVISRGKTLDSPPCTEDDPSCFQLRALPQAAIHPSIRSGLFRVDGSGMTVSHLILDGNRSVRLSSSARQKCQAGDNSQGMTSTVQARNFLFKNSVIKNTLCGTGMEVHPGTSQMHFQKNLVLRSGDNSTNMLWADGVTVLDADSSSFTDNTFIDNTDIQLVFGGCPECQISRNRFEHSSDPKFGAFGDLMIHSWTTTSGNYTNAVVSENSIDCGPQRLCGFGIIVGGDNWYAGTRVFGANIVRNSVRNAMIALSVDDATGSIHIADNQFDAGVDAEFSCHQNPQQRMKTAVYNVSPGSMKFLSSGSQQQFNQLRNQRGAAAVTSRDYDGCIPKMGLFHAKPFEAPVSVMKSCQWQGQTLSHGQTVTAYQQANVAAGSSCVSQSRVCQEGSLSGSFGAATCVVSAPPQPTYSSKTANFIRTLFVNALQRQANASEVESLGRMMGPSPGDLQCRSAMEIVLVADGEWNNQTRNLGNDAYLRRLYRAILFRDADLPGLKWYLEEMRTGRMNRQSVQNSLLFSNERKALCP